MSQSDPKSTASKNIPNKMKMIKKNESIVRKFLIFYTIMLWVAISIRYSIIYWLPETSPLFHFLKVDFNFFIEDFLYAGMVIFGASLMLKNMSLRNDKVTKFRRFTIWSYIGVTAIIYVIIPAIFWQFRGFNHTTLPFPFLSEIYMIPTTGRLYHEDFTITFGDTGILIFIISHAIVQILAYGGAFVFGRRAFCSCLCPWAGLVAETLGDALPSKSNNPKRPNAKGPSSIFLNISKILLAFQLIFTGLMMFFVLLYLGTGIVLIELSTLFMFEQLKIVVVDTLFFGIGFLLWGGRYYCCYCPAGFYVGMMGRLGGQQVETNHNTCIQCGKCNDACKMGIDIMSLAKTGSPVKTYRCTGCDCCVIACPKQCLKFTTRITRKLYSHNTKTDVI